MNNNIDFRWQLKDLPHYKITNKRDVYNCKTGRKLKRTVVGYTIGYWIAGKFYSLSRLNCSAEKIIKVDCPF